MWQSNGGALVYYDVPGHANGYGEVVKEYAFAYRIRPIGTNTMCLVHKRHVHH